MREYSTGPVYLVVDGHPTRKAKTVTTFVASTEGRLSVVTLVRQPDPCDMVPPDCGGFREVTLGRAPSPHPTVLPVPSTRRSPCWPMAGSVCARTKPRPWQQAAEAHRQLESGSVHERIILTLN